MLIGRTPSPAVLGPGRVAVLVCVRARHKGGPHRLQRPRHGQTRRAAGEAGPPCCRRSWPDPGPTRTGPGSRQEFDVLIVATSFGTGRARAGLLWQYVCAVAEDQPAGAREPRVFRSFCRVGTGLSREQHDLLEATPAPHPELAWSACARACVLTLRAGVSSLPSSPPPSCARPPPLPPLC